MYGKLYFTKNNPFLNKNFCSKLILLEEEKFIPESYFVFEVYLTFNTNLPVYELCGQV